MKSYIKFLSRNKLYTVIEAVGLVLSLGFATLTYGAYRKYKESNVPLALNVKGLLPVGKRFCPYVQASAGGYFGLRIGQ